MKVKIIKGNRYLAFFEDFISNAVISPSINELKKEAVNEVYRLCNQLENKLPKSALDVEIINTINACGDLSLVSEWNFDLGKFSSAKEYEKLKSLLIQYAFSFKCMTESAGDFESEGVLVDKLLDINGNLNGYNGGLIGAVFEIIESFDLKINSNQNQVKLQIHKNLFEIVNFAKQLYFNYLKNNVEGVTDSFFFGV